MGTIWSKEEVEYLEMNWSNTSITSMAKKLNRSINAIREKAYNIGLKRYIHSGEYITVNQLMIAIGRAQSSYTLNKWMKQGLPIKYRRSVTMKYRVIFIESFWKWAKEHRMLVDFSKVEKNILGDEPTWVKEQRKADVASSKYRKTPWTKNDDSMLIAMLKCFKYSYRDISVRIKRTEGAIKRRMMDLNIKMRPIKAEIRDWSEDEVKVVIDLYNKGYRSEVIAEYIDRSSLSINGKIERMIKAELLSKRITHYRKAN